MFISWFTHQFDVHGTEDYLGYDACCGQAGEHFEFIHNAFQYSKGNAIKVRGNPTRLRACGKQCFRP